jgi:C1A family cysteine protease
LPAKLEIFIIFVDCATRIILKSKHMKLKFTLASVFALAAMSALAQNQPEYEFTTIKENPVTSVKNQYRSGTCWCFSALSFIESEVLRTKGDTLDLSEMFVVGKSYHDRAEKYVDLTATSDSQPEAHSEMYSM